MANQLTISYNNSQIQHNKLDACILADKAFLHIFSVT